MSLDVRPRSSHHALLIGIRRNPYLDANLDGPKNDLILIGTLLIDRFGFAEDDLHVLLDEEATQTGIRAAMDEMVERVGRDDIFVLFYSGHGSRLADPKHPGAFCESIVPYDSGRDRRPNRDISDVEIDRWVQRLNAKTRHVTLIFDCCHSATLSRDPKAASRRSVKADLRPPEEMFEDARIPAILRSPRRPSTEDREGTGGRYVRGRHRAVKVAACRVDEEAEEYVHRESGKAYSYGALSHFLGRAMAGAAAGTTWRDIIETAGPAVTQRFAGQHPQIEGNWDEVLFGRHENLAAPYLKVTTVDHGCAVVSGGMAHGITPGSVWSVHDAGTRHPGAAGEIARLRIATVEIATSKAVPENAGQHPRLAVGQRAFLHRRHLPDPALRVRVVAGPHRSPALRALIAASSHLTEAEPAAVIARHLGDGVERPWTAQSTDGRLAVRARRNHETARLIADLEGRVRYRRLLEIANADPQSSLRGRVRLLVKRRHGAAFEAAETRWTDGLLTFDVGEVADFEVHNDSALAVWITLVQFGCDGSISRLIPLYRHPTYRPGGYRLEAGEGLALGEYYRQDPRFYYWDGVHVQLPALEDPWNVDSDTAVVHLKLIVTLEPTDFELIEQGPLLGAVPSGGSRGEARRHGPQQHPVLQLARLYAAGRGERSLAAESSPGLDWTTVTRPVLLRRHSEEKLKRPCGRAGARSLHSTHYVASGDEATPKEGDHHVDVSRAHP